MKKAFLTTLVALGAMSQIAFASNESNYVYDDEAPVYEEQEAAYDDQGAVYDDQADAYDEAAVYENSSIVYEEPASTYRYVESTPKRRTSRFDKAPASKPESENALLNRNSFFMQFNTGVWFHHIEGEYDGGYDEFSLDNTALSFTANFGVNFRRMFALYLGMNVFTGGGDMSFDRVSNEYKTEFWGFDIHIGALYFPFRKSPGMEGMYFGLELGLGMSVSEFVYGHYDYDEDISEEEQILKLKMGYAWNLSERMALGIESHLAFNEYPTSGTRYDDFYDFSGYSVGFSVTFIRR